MSAGERFSRFFARHRHVFAIAIALVTVFFAWQMRKLEIFTEFSAFDDPTVEWENTLSLKLLDFLSLLDKPDGRFPIVTP